MKEKFQQINYEARSTWIGLLILILFWCVAGFGMSQFHVTFLHMPLWVWTGCIGTWILGIIEASFLAKKVFKDMDLEEEENNE